MPDNSCYHYSLKVWFQSIEEAMVFPVAEAAWGRFKRALDERKKGFFICATKDGRTLAINLRWVQLAHFLWEESKTELPVIGGRSTEITLHFLGKAAESFHVNDPADLANIFSALKSSEGGETLSFTDIEENMVTFLARDLVILQTSTIFVEEGYLKIFKRLSY